MSKVAKIKFHNIIRVSMGLLLEAIIVDGVINVGDTVCFSEVNQYKILNIGFIYKEDGNPNEIAIRIDMPSRKKYFENGMDINEFKAFLMNYTNKELNVIAANSKL